MQSNYPESIRRVLLSEGGYVNLKADPGGETNFGITIAVARANGYTGPMRTMPLDVAKRIYKARYADPCHFDDLPAGLDYAILDYAVNSGVGRANKVLRRVLALDDSAPFHQILGQLSTRDTKAVINAVCDERLRFLSSLKTWSVFGKGWAARMKAVRAAALNMAAAQLPAPAVKREGMPPQGKGEVPKPNTTGAIIPAGAGVSIGGGFSFEGWISMHPVWSILIGGIALVVIIAIIEFIARKWQAARQDAVTPGVVVVPEVKSAQG